MNKYNLLSLLLLTTGLLVVNVQHAEACVPTPNTWDGSESSDWNDPDNYSKGRLPNGWDTRLDIDANSYANAPVVAADATFTAPPIRLSNSASLTVNANATADNVQIRGGTSSISVSSGARLTVTGDFDFALPGTSNISGAGSIDVGGDMTLSASNIDVNNTGNINISGDLRTAGITAGIDVNNNAGGLLDIGGDIDFSGAVNDLVNNGRLILQGSFQGITVGGKVENTATGEWYWSYGGASWDLDILSVFIDNGTFVYSASSTQNIIPISYNNLRIDGTGTKTLVDNINVNNNLDLSNGNVILGDNNLTVSSTGAISGGSSSSFIVTDGVGAVIQQNIGSGGRTGDVLFPVGFTTGSYTPLTINNSTGTADDFSVRLVDALYEDGSTGTEQTSDVVDRTWFIDESINGGSDATLTFQWNDAEGLGGFSPASMHIVHHDGSEWERLWSGTASGTGPYTASATGVSDFSPFGIEGDASPLPVELVEFKAIFADQRVKASWTTAAEINNDYFILERSSTADNFEEIGRVEGNGTTNEAVSYESIDSEPFGGSSYYRLTQVDFDGTTKVYPPIKVDVPLSNNVQAYVYPTPSNGDYINIQLFGFDKSVTTKLKLMSIKGEVMHEQELFIDKDTGVSEKVNFSRPLPPGMYILSVSTPSPIIKRIVVK